jgi:hypothetical protein
MGSLLKEGPRQWLAWIAVGLVCVSIVSAVLLYVYFKHARADFRGEPEPSRFWEGKAVTDDDTHAHVQPRRLPGRLK